MNPMFLKFLPFLLQLATDAPHLLAQGVQAFADIAHGEGGLAKVQKAVNDLAGIVNGIPAPAAVQATTQQQQPQ